MTYLWISKKFLCRCDDEEVYVAGDDAGRPAVEHSFMVNVSRMFAYLSAILAHVGVGEIQPSFKSWPFARILQPNRDENHVSQSSPNIQPHLLHRHHHSLERLHLLRHLQ